MGFLASLPLKASIVVLDVARRQPFVEGGQPMASGLALVEPDARMLIAFNAAPGTVAPDEPGPYGVYAQSLAERKVLAVSVSESGLVESRLFEKRRERGPVVRNVRSHEDREIGALADAEGGAGGSARSG